MAFGSRAGTSHVLAAATLLSLVATVFPASNISVDPVAQQFDRYIQDFGKPYGPGSAEYEKRFLHFQASLERIQVLNEQSRALWSAPVIDNGRDPYNGPAVHAINQFSDMSPGEFREERQCVHKGNSSFATANPIPEDHLTVLQGEAGNLGDTRPQWDWREQNVVTGIKNQQSCGSCWAFAAVETIESAWAIKTQTLYDLSVQQLISCARTNLNNGCKGGRYEEAYAWFLQNKYAVDFSSEYPYYDGKGADLPCRSVKTASPVRLSKYVSLIGKVTSANEKSILSAAVYNFGPLAISVNAVSWQDYEKGIIQHHCTSDPMDHAVVIVGYDLTAPVPYWIVRNTWGTGWGMDGYVTIAIGENLCGLEAAPAYVIV